MSRTKLIIASSAVVAAGLLGLGGVAMADSTDSGVDVAGIDAPVSSLTDATANHNLDGLSSDSVANTDAAGSLTKGLGK